MRRAMLEVVANGSVSRPADVLRYISCTLLAGINHEEVLSSSSLSDVRRQLLVMSGAARGPWRHVDRGAAWGFLQGSAPCHPSQISDNRRDQYPGDAPVIRVCAGQQAGGDCLRQECAEVAV